MKNFAIYLAAGASALLVTAASAAPLSPNASVVPESNIQNVRWFVMNQANAGANVVNAASSFAITMIRMGMLAAAGAISNAGAIGRVAASASARRVLASE